jgi:DNA-binding NarL/FixJ family response regulator
MSSRNSAAYGEWKLTMSLKVVSEAIRLVQAGGMYIPASSLLAAQRPNEVRGAESNSRLSGLTNRQLAVLEAVRRGKANKIIAYELNMCESTVKVHLRNIMKKLPLRANDDETQTRREFTLEGRGHNIRWLCPF